MRVLSTAILIFILISSIAYSQYFWELKQPGSSLGGPVDVEKNNSNNVYYGSNNIIYKSTDRGETFSPLGIPVPGAAEIKNIILNDDNPSEFLIAIETQNKILKTTNAGSSWSIVADNLSFSYFGIPMTPDPTHPDTIYSMNGNSVMRSTNFGDTWSTISTISIPTDGPCDIEVFPDTSIILVGDNSTGIFRSTDYGLTWNQVHNTTGEIPTIAVDYQKAGIAWATRWSGGGGLLKSTDYGATWELQNHFAGFNMWGVHVDPQNSDYLIAGQYSGGVMHITHNGGGSWVSASTGSSNYQVYIVDTMTVFAAQGNGLYKLNSDYFIPVELISFTANVINNKAVLQWTTATETNNSGFDIEISPDNHFFNKIAFIPGFGTSSEQHHYNFAYDKLLSKNYFRLKQIDFDGSFEYSDVVEVNGMLPAEFYLSQNHPNPFNPSTSIRFSLPVDASVKISLFNLLGEKVSEIANSNFSAGIHTINFTAGSLSSGTYLYLLEAAGNNGVSFNQTKKMLLLK